MVVTKTGYRAKTQQMIITKTAARNKDYNLKKNIKQSYVKNYAQGGRG